jgi:hypothetical protein
MVFTYLFLSDNRAARKWLSVVLHVSHLGTNILFMAQTSKYTFQISCQSPIHLRRMLDLVHNYLVGIQTIPKQICKQNPGHLEICKVTQSTYLYQPKKQHIGVALGILKKSQNKLTFDFEKKSKYFDF